MDGRCIGSFSLWKKIFPYKSLSDCSGLYFQKYSAVAFVSCDMCHEGAITYKYSDICWEFGVVLGFEHQY